MVFLNHSYEIQYISLTKGKWNSDYSKFGEVEYMDVYSPEISTKYGEVFWTMMDPVPLDKDIVNKFSGNIMAVVGYETDQVV